VNGEILEKMGPTPSGNLRPQLFRRNSKRGTYMQQGLPTAVPNGNAPPPATVQRQGRRGMAKGNRQGGRTKGRQSWGRRSTTSAAFRVRGEKLAGIGQHALLKRYLLQRKDGQGLPLQVRHRPQKGGGGMVDSRVKNTGLSRLSFN